jgi:hypothetical protein
MAFSFEHGILTLLMKTMLEIEYCRQTMLEMGQ